MQRRSLTFVLRSSTFLLWCVIGALLTYAALYAISLSGLLLIAPALAAAMALESLGGATWPETFGLLGGPGLFCLIIATAAEASSTLMLVGAAWTSAVLVAYLALGTARCSSSY